MESIVASEGEESIEAAAGCGLHTAGCGSPAVTVTRPRRYDILEPLDARASRRGRPIALLWDAIEHVAGAVLKDGQCWESLLLAAHRLLGVWPSSSSVV
jgi:hypothetical protein